MSCVWGLGGSGQGGEGGEGKQQGHRRHHRPLRLGEGPPGGASPRSRHLCAGSLAYTCNNGHLSPPSATSHTPSRRPFLGFAPPLVRRVCPFRSAQGCAFRPTLVSTPDEFPMNSEWPYVLF